MHGEEGNIETEESKIVSGDMRDGEHGKPAASRFTKVRCFFPVFILLPESRDVSLPPSSLLSLYSSTLPTLKCFGRSSKLVPSGFSLYSSFFFPAFVSSPFRPFPARVIPFSILPSFMFFRALSHLLAVSTSISKKSSRELFVGKCREPAVLRARAEIEVRKANEIKKNDVEGRKKVWRRTILLLSVPSHTSPSTRRLYIFFLAV